MNLRGVTLDNLAIFIADVKPGDYYTLSALRQRCVSLAQTAFGDKSQHVADVLNIQTSAPVHNLFMAEPFDAFSLSRP